MILVDANILLYGYDRRSPKHEAARSWLEARFSEPERLALPWASVLAFVRISTNPRLMQHPLALEEAIQIASTWLNRPNVVVLSPGERHWEILQTLLVEGQASGPLVTDAHLAALTVEHGATLATADRGFTRFPGLKLINPLRN
jgi:toxin-antitoxin system PIN domain toxin